MSLVLKGLIFGIGDFRSQPINQKFSECGLYQIAGANGAGKTTLLRTLLGRLRPQAGYISNLKIPIGASGVECLLVHQWTVRDNIDFLKSLSGASPLSNLDPIESVMSYPVSHLSEGWKRKVELSFLLSHDFSLLLLDEPLAPLDQKERSFFSEWIIKQSADRLILFTHHDGDSYWPRLSGSLDLNP